MEEQKNSKGKESLQSKCPAAASESTSTASRVSVTIDSKTKSMFQSFWSFLSPSDSTTCPPSITRDSQGCPNTNTRNSILIPASIEEAAQHPQAPHYPDQSIPLNTQREVSSIPRGGVEGQQWMYPSEQQFYNAMRRKGYDADAASMPYVVQIHNAVNERTWKEVRQWENELHNVENPRLVRFLGRPEQRSPKAWWNVLTGKNPPFDRHDWYIDRGDGIERRYVIDFYEGKSSSSSGNNAAPVSMYLDVRPALDDSQALLDRIRMAVRDTLPGIFRSDSNNHHPPISQPPKPKEI